VLQGLRADQISQGRMSYELCLHGLIERRPKSHRYRLTDQGLQTALFYTREYSRILRPGLALVSPQAPSNSPATLQRTFRAAQQAVNTWCNEANFIHSRNLVSRHEEVVG
jgi:hypothetical protein